MKLLIHAIIHLIIYIHVLSITNHVIVFFILCAFFISVSHKFIITYLLKQPVFLLILFSSLRFVSVIRISIFVMLLSQFRKCIEILLNHTREFFPTFTGDLRDI